MGPPDVADDSLSVKGRALTFAPLVGDVVSEANMVSTDAQSHHLLKLGGEGLKVGRTVLLESMLVIALGECSSDAIKIFTFL